MVDPQGTVAEGWEPVREAFVANFSPSRVPGSDGAADKEDPGDQGAALCIVRGGRVVVDLWGGERDDAGTPWTADTLVDVYSVGKPVAALLALDAVQRGELDLDGPAAVAWPELRRHHAGTTVRQLLSHQAGLPAVLEPLPDEAIYDWGTMCSALAATPPWWDPGTGHGYHVNTYGFLATELARRGHGGPVPDVLADRLTRARDADLFFGVPDADLGRCADVKLGGGTADRMHAVLDEMWPPGAPTLDDPATMRRQAYLNPRTGSGFTVVNTDAWRRCAVPSTNGHASARAVARIFADLLPGAARPVLDRGLLAEATTTQSEGDDLVLGRTTRFGLGFMLHQDDRPVGATPAAFGHYGYGGSLGSADPDAELAFAYLLNRPGDRWQNPRTVRLLDAVRTVIGA